ncbi:aldehyde dehydrogenase domain-containing protein [Microdochium trichocladiopsis]|uniref:aldehyde dehydrogenase (NAD(+)) n=1 Tax=Microdochium trichocladiopsis TaxID=1682393 RepID=A0A9P8YI72_9PEZI|nr:aldehyde dehydrogenase domain-containing protein [Microdochium trichocladiopsis]KAH7039721.1 aldehyde dehydrogenase domain-containing protein [Microdochium trichocladiopsis]
MPSDLIVRLTAPNGRQYDQPTGLFINNEWVASSDGGKITSINPSNEQDIIAVHAATTQDVDLAVRAAHQALRHPSWASLAASDRGKLLYRLAQLVDDHRETLATIETWDNGKPYSASLGEDMVEVSETLRYYAGFADKNFGQVIETTADKFAYTVREPVGVCGQIIPWNYPLAMAAWKLGPALACGNTVVLKPAEQTPLSILFFANLVAEAGFPAGVVNIVNGLGSVAGAALAEHPLVAKIAFTGSTATARAIMRSASGTLKNMTLETGGKSPLVVFDDADVELAAEWAHAGIMSNQGQICTATSRVLVQRGVYDAFLEAFKARVRDISRVGDPFDEATFQGPQVTRAQMERVLAYVDVGVKEGATLEMGGRERLVVGGQQKGFYVQPAVFTNVTPQMRVFQEEVFGPFVVLAAFESEDEVVALANDSQYGLGSAVFTRDLTRAHRVARRIEAGMVWINSSNDSDWRVPFGGVKQSGIGRELGEAGLAAYSTIKAIHVNMRSKL